MSLRDSRWCGFTSSFFFFFFFFFFFEAVVRGIVLQVSDNLLSCSTSPETVFSLGNLVPDLVHLGRLAEWRC